MMAAVECGMQLMCGIHTTPDVRVAQASTSTLSIWHCSLLGAKTAVAKWRKLVAARGFQNPLAIGASMGTESNPAQQQTCFFFLRTFSIATCIAVLHTYIIV